MMRASCALSYWHASRGTGTAGGGGCVKTRRIAGMAIGTRVYRPLALESLRGLFKVPYLLQPHCMMSRCMMSRCVMSTALVTLGNLYLRAGAPVAAA
jgi:hypothetical protein